MIDICFVWETYELNKIYEYLAWLYNCDDMWIIDSNALIYNVFALTGSYLIY